MADTVEQFIVELEDLASILIKTEVNWKKCPKTRMTRDFLEAEIQGLDESMKLFRTAHRKLLRVVTKDTMQTLKYFTQDEFISYEESFMDLKANIKDKLLTVMPHSADNPQSQPPGNTQVDSQNESKVKQPRIELPKISAVSEKKILCSLCHESHPLCHCEEFSKLEPAERYVIAKKNNLCFNCLIPGHSTKQCRNSISCRVCHKRHHSLLHQSKFSVESPKQQSNEGQAKVSLYTNVEEAEEIQVNNVVASHVMRGQGMALLATAMVKVSSEQGYTSYLRALIDPGSQACFISERATQALKATRYPMKGNVVGVGSTKATISQAVQLELTSLCEPYTFDVKAYVMSNQLTAKIPTSTIMSYNWPHIEGLELADTSYHTPGAIDLLLGVNEYAKIIQTDLIKGPPGTPTAQKTNLGWILFGETNYSPLEENTMIVMHHQVDVEDLLKSLWEIDTTTKRNYTTNEMKCEEIYETTHTRNKEGKYIVKIPFKDETIQPEGSRDIALKRLTQLERRLDKTPELKNEYNKVLQEYLDMGHMEEVPKEEVQNTSVYLPHHAIVRADRETTKVRVVFDASCKGVNGVSLNDMMLTGPVLQEDLRSIIMRWRLHKVCYMSDVVKMYRMIFSSEECTDQHRILWRATERDDIKDYRLLTVTFGTAAAPYLAVRTLMQIAEDEGKHFPNAARVIREDFFVDDCMSGCSNVKEAIQTSKELETMLARGGFLLQKWSSNNVEFLQSINPSKRSIKTTVDLKIDGTVKALGLHWNLNEDEFTYKVSLELNPVTTKRGILSDLQKVFDPLGWIAPAVVRAKMLIQKLWLEGFGWDEEISTPLQEEWLEIRTDLQSANDFSMKRWLNTNSNIQDITLHGFCDASARAYAAVVYCRVQGTQGDIHTSLVAARTRVAPVKPVSLPRLELCGAVLLSQMLVQVSQAMRIPKKQIFAWTDATVVLSWIFGEPWRWKTFVANRVVEIVENVSSSQWYHVQTQHNPADLPSRGAKLCDLKHNKLWWSGPEWLATEEVQFSRPIVIPTDLERKRMIQANTNIYENEENKQTIKPDIFSNIQEFMRVIAQCRRFLKSKKEPETLGKQQSCKEMEEGLEVCIRMVQQEEYEEEIQRLSENKPLKKSSSIRTLNPYLAENKFLRVGGRLRHAAIENDSKHPITIGKHNTIVPLLIAEAHTRTLHGGNQMMHTYLQSKYWIVGCKSLIRQHIHRCLTCARQRATNRPQMMGDLPEVRVTPARAFLHSGVDFAGPINVLNSRGRGARTTKAYICVFVCMATKAIHLELMSDLTTAAFIAAFKRFVARRGRCNEIWSDNGKNFVGASKELADMWKESGLQLPDDVADTLTKDGTQWRFIPPYSPNWGGLWEAGVKSIKYHLKRIVTSNLTFEELTTVLCQIEACLNSRPLTILDPSDHDNLQPLTPGHFLIGEPIINVPEISVANVNVSRLTRWQHIQKMTQDFWRRWQTEYLSRQRPKWLKRTPEYEVGEIVLLKEDNLPPSKWALGRIAEKHPGPDDITRVYTVRYNGKLRQRSVSKICPLPIDYK